MKTMHQIVIVGGGAGGLELATKLGRKLGKKQKAKIILIDKNLTHVWKPLLHQVAAGALNPNEDEIDYFAQAKVASFEFQLGEMTAIDSEQKIIQLAPIIDADGNVWTEQRTLRYDTLILAIGSITHDFGVTGAKENALFLDSRIEADRFHRQLMYRYLRAQTNGLPASLSIAIVGAGATGVELAAELVRSSQQLVSYGLSEIKPEAVTINILEGADRVLPALPQRISKAVTEHLQNLGIKIHTNCIVTSITKNALSTKNGATINADFTVWTAGVKAPEYLAKITSIETNKLNQILVNATLQTTKNIDIFAFGDCASCPQSNGKTVPPRAQAAHQQASLLVKSMKKRLQNKALPVYRYKDYGSLISLSKFSTVGSLMSNLTPSIPVEGKLASLFYISLYRMHQRALHGLPRTILLIMKDWLSHRTKPRLKLH